jgi:hypothetical protein
MALGGEYFNYKVIKDPKPTFEDGPLTRLYKAGEIRDTDNQDYFIASPDSLTINPETADLYIYDGTQFKIFKYDKDLKYVKCAGNRGEGPGDFKVSASFHIVHLYFNNNKVYGFNQYGRQIVIFDKDLNFLDMFRFKQGSLTYPFAVDRQERFYVRDLRKGIQVFCRDLGITAKHLENPESYEFLFFDPPICLFKNLMGFRSLTIKFDLIDGSNLIAYSKASSTVYLFENNRLMNRFNLYSKPMLEDFKKALVRSAKNLKKRQAKLKNSKRRRGTCSYVSMFSHFFIDKDENGQRFYLQKYDGKNKRSKIYKFDLAGKLKKTFYVAFDADGGVPDFVIKANNLFYGTTREGRIVTYKKKNKKNA